MSCGYNNRREIRLTLSSTTKKPFDPREEVYADQIAEIITWEYEHMGNAKSLSDIMTRYKLLLESGKREGFTPVIAVPDRMMHEVLAKDFRPDNETPESIIESALSLDPKAVLDRLLKGNTPIEDDFGYLGE